MLHTISTAIESRINTQMISKNDRVLFWQNGVLITLQNNILLNNIFAKTPFCYVLDSDIIARGLTQFIDGRISVITMQQVVKLTADHFPQMNWE